MFLRISPTAPGPLRARATGSRTCVPALILLAVLGLTGFPGRLHAAQILPDDDETLFCVMAAINAAGYDEGADLPDNSPIRKEVNDYLASRKIDVLSELKLFYKHHAKRTVAADLPQYISFALAVTGPPDFGWKTRDVDVPPDAMALDGFQNLMIDFYRQADLDALWSKVKPAYEQELAYYHKPLLDITQTVDFYLRASSADYPARRFHFLVEQLIAPRHVDTFNYGDDTYIVVSPAAKPLLYDIRHAYIFFEVDPIMLSERAALAQKRSLLDLVQLTPLPDEYKSDFALLAGQSLTKAMEARFDKDTAAIDRATRQGYILTPFFSEQLPVFEDQEQNMRNYAQTMIDAIDLKAETARLSSLTFDTAPLRRKAETVVVAGPGLSDAGKTLEKAETLFSARAAAPGNLEAAKSLFGKAMDQKGTPAEHAQAWYGLARIALTEKRNPAALDGFQKTLDSSPDDYTKAWAYVYMGMLYRSQHNFDLATKNYQNALAVTGASDKAKQAASSALQQISNNQETQTQ